MHQPHPTIKSTITLPTQKRYLFCPPCCQRSTKIYRHHFRTWQTQHNDLSLYKRQRTVPSFAYQASISHFWTVVVVLQALSYDFVSLYVHVSCCYSLHSNWASRSCHRPRSVRNISCTQTVLVHFHTRCTHAELQRNIGQVSCWGFKKEKRKRYAEGEGRGEREQFTYWPSRWERIQGHLYAHA